jgi:hypothetical protein
MKLSPSDLLHPRADRLDRMGESVRAHRLETVVKRQPLEVAPGREDQPRLSAPVRARALRRRGDPESAEHSPSTRSAASPDRRRGQKKERVEAPSRMEFGNPPRQRRQRAKSSSSSPLRSSSSAEVLVRQQAALQAPAPDLDRGPGRPTGTAVSSSVRGSPRRAPPSPSSPKRIFAVDPASGEDQRSAGKAMPSARSTISSSGGPPGRSRTVTSVAAGIASLLSIRGELGDAARKKKAAGLQPAASKQVRLAPYMPWISSSAGV